MLNISGRAVRGRLRRHSFCFGRHVFTGHIPAAKPRQSLEQTIGDTQVRIVYHRPNLKERLAFGSEGGAVVPYGEVWRAGANEATVFEFTNDVQVNGKELPKGKYSFYVIPNERTWTIIFNKSWDQWGTQYDGSKDAVRFDVTPIVAKTTDETLTYSVDDVTEHSARIVLSWDKTRIPFVVDVGDVHARVLRAARREIIGGPINAANYVLSNGLSESYEEAVGWVNASLSQMETYGALFTKSRLLAELGRKDEAVAIGEKALEVGRASNVNPNSLSFLERLIAGWKSEE